jgi:hypothetical protein
VVAEGTDRRPEQTYRAKGRGDVIQDHLVISGLTDDESHTVNRLWKDLRQKAARNLLRASYYDGKRALRDVGTIIPPQYYRLGIVLGWSAKAVDILARRCNLDGFVWPDGDLAGLGYRKLEQANHLTAEVSSAAISSLIYGTSFLVNTTGDVEAGEPASLIHVKDGLSATGDWNPRARRLTNLLSIIGFDRDGNPDDLVLYLDNLTVTASKADGAWTVDRTPHTWGVPAEPFVYKPRVGRPFGYSRISRPVMSLHDQALRTVIRMEGHADVYSWPELWMLGADESIFKNADGSQKASWQVMLGRIKAIPDDPQRDGDPLARADIKQIPASSPEPHIAQLKQQAQLFSGETSIPLTSLGVSDMSNPTSADSYIASREDLIAEAEGATDDWTPPLRKAILRGLAIQNGLDAVPDSWASIEPKWRSPLYQSRAAQADAGLKQLSAAPDWLRETDVGLELLGLSPQQIKRAKAAEAAAKLSLAATAGDIPGTGSTNDGSAAGSGA